MGVSTHEYAINTKWTGAGTEGTRSYSAYSRDFELHSSRKRVLLCSADTMFHGDPGRHNPEDLFLGAISACHMLVYLALCSRYGIRVLDYRDEAEGVLTLNAGVGEFTQVTLRPTVVISVDSNPDLARSLGDQAGERCFIARSCRVPVCHEFTIEVEDSKARIL
jgi:organic hydroperoxide reductase OsmC/OhrA